MIDATPLFLSSIAEFSPFPDLPAEVRMMIPFGGSFQSDRSKIEEFKAFEDNIIVKSMMTYTTDKEGPLTTIEARNIIILPEIPMDGLAFLKSLVNYLTNIMIVCNNTGLSIGGICNRKIWISTWLES